MTTISLFHKPTFDDKLYAITVPAYRNALLAAMFAFAARWIRNGSRDQAHPEQPQCSPQEYFDLAMRLLHTALEECSPDEPPLCLLQAMVLTTFYQLIEGVRGKAWRYLGTCIRIAYELRLSTLDSDRAVLRDTAMIPTDISGWVADEERRRVWWALWEFDTFASSIQEAPTAIDAACNETFLPIDDENWFNQRPTRSCMLERNPVKRWKSLQSSGNQSGKAWFIVINSYMRSAQLLSKLSASSQSNDTSQTNRRPSHLLGETEEDPYPGADTQKNLAIIANCLSCFSIALPQALRHVNRPLGFSMTERQHDSDILAISLMTQLAWLKVFQHDLFITASKDGRSETKGRKSALKDVTSRSSLSSDNSHFDFDNNAWCRSLSAADNILSNIQNSSTDHIQFVSPFLASIVWSAAALLLVYKVFRQSEPQANLIESKMDLLRSNFKQYLSFWGIAPDLERKLDIIEQQLCRLRNPGTEKFVRQSSNNISIGEVVPNTCIVGWAPSSSPSKDHDQQIRRIGDYQRSESIGLNPEAMNTNQENFFISPMQPVQSQQIQSQQNVVPPTYNSEEWMAVSGGFASDSVPSGPLIDYGFGDADWDRKNFLTSIFDVPPVEQ